jgi:hypothetical protein
MTGAAPKTARASSLFPVPSDAWGAGRWAEPVLEGIASFIFPTSREHRSDGGGGVNEYSRSIFQNCEMIVILDIFMIM